MLCRVGSNRSGKSSAREEAAAADTIEDIIIDPDAESQEASDADDDGHDFVVERIVKARMRSDGGREFLVKWQRYALDRSDWQPEENFKNCRALDVWERKHGKTPK